MIKTMEHDYREHIDMYFNEVKLIADKIDKAAIDKLAKALHKLREEKGRLFVLGVGGSAAMASHAVNDLRKIGHIESYTPIDNVSELTAWVNDRGWEWAFVRWLEQSNLTSKDAILVFSVGGGDEARNISPNIVHALKYAKEKGAKVFGVVGRDGGYTGQVADVAVLIPVVNPDTVTAHSESWHAVVLHAIILHPKFKQIEGTWEAAAKKEAPKEKAKK